MWAKHPRIARRWANEFPKQKNLPEKIAEEKQPELNPLLAPGSSQKRFVRYDKLVDKVLEKISELKVQRGLINNTVKVDGEEYKVNEGYLKPGLMGFGIGTLAHSAISAFKSGRPGVAASLAAGGIGAATALGITEVKRKMIQNILNKDVDTAKSLAKKGFNIQSRTLEGVYGLTDLAESITKESSLSEAKMLRSLDETEDNAHMANALVEGAGLLGLAAGDTAENSKGLLQRKAVRGAGKVNIVYAAMADKDSALADATSGAQFALYAPRILGDIKNIKRNRILGSTAYAIARATPGLAPAAARILKKKYSDI